MLPLGTRSPHYSLPSPSCENRLTPSAACCSGRAPLRRGSALQVATRQLPPVTESDSDVIIEFRDVCKSFGSKAILSGASFKIHRGEAVGIIGASGTGKSTTLRLIAGLLAPDSGDILINGLPRSGLAEDDPHISDALTVGLVFQNAALFDSLTVGENVGFMLYENSALPYDTISELVVDCLKRVGLTGVDRLMPSQLSGGMKKRVALARAIIADESRHRAEQVILYDEPTAGLDPVASTVVEDLMRSMHTPGGQSAGGAGDISSYLVVTHQHSTIRRAVDRIVFLHDGVVAWQGSVSEFDATEEPIVRQFATGDLKGPIKYL